jgi:hypothetical protein
VFAGWWLAWGGWTLRWNVNEVTRVYWNWIVLSVVTFWFWFWVPAWMRRWERDADRVFVFVFVSVLFCSVRFGFSGLLFGSDSLSGSLWLVPFVVLRPGSVTRLAVLPCFRPSRCSLVFSSSLLFFLDTYTVPYVREPETYMASTPR